MLEIEETSRVVFSLGLNSRATLKRGGGQAIKPCHSAGGPPAPRPQVMAKPQKPHKLKMQGAGLPKALEPGFPLPWLGTQGTFLGRRTTICITETAPTAIF